MYTNDSGWLVLSWRLVITVDLGAPADESTTCTLLSRKAAVHGPAVIHGRLHTSAWQSRINSASVDPSREQAFNVCPCSILIGSPCHSARPAGVVQPHTNRISQLWYYARRSVYWARPVYASEQQCPDCVPPFICYMKDDRIPPRKSKLVQTSAVGSKVTKTWPFAFPYSFIQHLLLFLRDENGPDRRKLTCNEPQRSNWVTWCWFACKWDAASRVM